MVNIIWREIDLIRRDTVLEREIYPRLRQQTPFLLAGKHGVGKTAFLEWGYDPCFRKKAFCSGGWTVRGEVEVESPRVEGEELNLAPVLLIGIGVLVVVRHLGAGLDRAELIGGVGMGLAILLSDESDPSPGDYRHDNKLCYFRSQTNFISLGEPHAFHHLTGDLNYPSWFDTLSDDFHIFHLHDFLIYARSMWSHTAVLSA